MEHASALEAALYLMQSPSQVRLIRSRPLPDGIEVLLRIAANDADTIRQATEWLGRSPETIRQAAAFFIEQILFFPDADSYRILGTTAEASNGDLRRNMALLLRWLHPDLDPHGERSVFARRVTRAWNDLKTHERREAYDRSRRLSGAQQSSGRKRRRMRPKPPQAKSEQPHELGRSGPRPRQYRVGNPYPDGFLRRVFQSLLDRFAL
jgi:hypothetical protein